MHIAHTGRENARHQRRAPRRHGHLLRRHHRQGETTAQRIEFAYTLRSTGALSIPVNILHPIEGTPLENCPPLMPEEVFDFIAVLRLINPKATIRFAGGRASLTREQQLKAAYIGANAAIAGSLLTTAGPDIEEDEKMFHAHGADQ